MKYLALLLVSFILFACNSTSTNDTTNTTVTEAKAPVLDSSSRSNADVVSFKHLFLDISVDFNNRRISGSATWDIANTNATEAILDTYFLGIDSAFADGKPVTFILDSFRAVYGSGLHIPITTATKQISIRYHTTDSALALQWLSPAQTAGKTQPFLYTQSEAINARSWLPCPDAPGIRYTYDARVKVPANLLALMSATNPQVKNSTGIYKFKMEQPIPAYLMALAVGDIAFRSIDGRTGVYAETAMIDKARYEFEDVGKMVTTAESIYGPYRWGRYDALVLPPGFPIGGMENPRLTFCTPTIIAGDRSLMNLIAHELAHSWSGNLVTNATWDDIWMNEGFTVYFERRITEAMTNKSYVDMLWELGYQDLADQITEFKDNPRDTWLKLHVEGRHPDDGLSDVPYEKGSLFLWLIERRVGRPKFDAFLNQYFKEHAFHSITTEEFLTYLRTNLIKNDTALENSLTIDKWVYGPGIPANCPRPDTARFSKVDSARTAWLTGASPATALGTGSWSTFEWLRFLRNMPILNYNQMKGLDDAFRFTQTGNSEIADLWFIMAVKNGYQEAFPAMEIFLSTVGRQKFLVPLYTELGKLARTDNCIAYVLYQKYRANYHPLTQKKLDRYNVPCIGG